MALDVNATMLHKDVPIPVNETGIINDITPEQNAPNDELVEVDNEIDVNVNNDLSEHYTADPALNLLDNFVHDSTQALAADGSSVSAAEIATSSDQLIQEINAVTKIIKNQPIKDASQLIDADGFHNLPNIIVISSQSITVEMMLDNFTCYLTFVYAATSYIDRRFLWQELISLSSLCSCPWLLVGDFNAILGAHERHSGGLPLGTSCSDFSSMINNCNLSHLEVEENQFTWSYGSVSRGYMEQRLDRALCNLQFYDAWPISKCVVLPRTCSDHSALLISGAGTLSLGPRPFKFHSMWLEHLSFKDIVLSCWNASHFYGCPMFVLTSKLKALKSCLKSWNLQVFGNVHANVTEARNKLSVIQSAISSTGGSDELFQESPSLNIIC